MDLWSSIHSIDDNKWVNALVVGRQGAGLDEPRKWLKVYSCRKTIELSFTDSLFL